MTQSVNIHATCIRIDRAGKMLGAPPAAGVLLLGKSGAGKSELALRLIALGAKLVSDDRTELSVLRGRLVASAPAQLAGLIEVRGVGIVKMPHGASARIALVVDLSAKVERMPKTQFYRPSMPLILPQSARPRLIALCAFEASAPDKIAAVLGALHHKTLRDVVKRN